jgi:hypothetical protein
MSCSASWEDFSTTIPTEDTDSITITLAARQRNEIHGFSSRDDLLIFTGSAEWVASAGQKSDVFTPSSVVVTPATYRGSVSLEPMDVGTATLFVQEYGRVVRAMGYQIEIDGYNSTEASIMSEHLTEDTRIRRWIYQQEPWSVVWMVLENGVVLTLTIQQEHQVTAWTRQVFNGAARDICSIPGSVQDEVFMLMDDGDDAKLVLLHHRNDRGGTFSPSDYLDDETDPYTTVFESLELEGDVNGSLQGRPKQVSGATVRLFRSTSLKAGIITENSTKLDVVHNSESPYTGDIYARLPGGMGKTCRLRIEKDTPGPLTVLGIFQEVTVHEN